MRAIDATQIDSVAVKSLAAGPLAGLAVGITTSQDTLVRGYGTIRAGGSDSVRSTTPFRIGSLTKQFTAAAILQLAEQKLLSVDDEVTTYLPGLSTNGNHVTIRELLSHTSGIVRYGTDDIIYLEGYHYTASAVLDFLGQNPFKFQPGTDWHYSNLGYILLGLVIERVTGRTYADYLNRSIFHPLGMRDTYIIEDEAMAPVGHATTSAGLELYEEKGNSAWAAGGAVSTVGDILKWQAALNSHTILRAESVKLMYETAVLNDGIAIPYGLGTRFGDFHGHRVVGHSGWWAGFTSMLAFYPDDSVTIVVLSNTGSLNQHAVNIAARIAEVVIDLAKTSPARMSKPRTILAHWTGTYVRGNATVKVTASQGHLHLRDSGFAEVQLRPLGENRFSFGKWVVEFHEGNNGAKRLFRFNDGMFWDQAMQSTQPK